MKIRLYIVTYKRNDVLNNNLNSLWKVLPLKLDITVTVLANHPDVVINPENNRDNLNVVINTVRMPFAWGNLTKDWNYGILDGFKNWQNPDNVDWVILAQNDVIWQEGWVEKLIGYTNLDFITQPTGDQVLALRINAVKKVGFFDERLCTLHFQELDYFSRAALSLQQRASINDNHKGELSSWNSVGAFMIAPTYSGVTEEDNFHTIRFHKELAGLMVDKWKFDDYLDALNIQLRMSKRAYYIKNLPREINWYPFFWDGIPELPQSLQWYNSLPLGKVPLKVKIKSRIKSLLHL